RQIAPRSAALFPACYTDEVPCYAKKVGLERTTPLIKAGIGADQPQKHFVRDLLGHRATSGHVQRITIEPGFTPRVQLGEGKLVALSHTPIQLFVAQLHQDFTLYCVLNPKKFPGSSVLLRVSLLLI